MNYQKLNTQNKSSAVALKQRSPSARFIFDILLLLLRLAYLYSIHFMAVKNLEYLERFISLNHYHIMMVIDLLIVTHEFAPAILNNQLRRLVARFPKWNLVVYVLCSLIAFFTCASCLFKCGLIIAKELFIGWCMHKLMEDRQNGYVKSLAFWNRLINRIKFW